MDAPSPLFPEALPPGTLVDHWRVVEKLGTGGYGAVYRVEAVGHPGVPLALKLALRPGDARAGREAMLLMEKAVHPHVVRLHGCGRWPDPVEGHDYHVMDLVPGVPLDVWAETLNPSFLRFAEVGAKLAGALGELHGRGVYHRDLKPENILIREPDGEPVLVDFGVGDYVGAAPLTSTPLPPGTTHLRTPEAMRFWLEHGARSGERYEAGAADDLYALGVSLYRAAAGHYPFPPGLPADMLGVVIALKRARAPGDFNRRMPRALSDVLARMLAKAPGERYRDGAEVHAALMAAAAFGRRARWEASLFEWEEVPAGERKDGAPARRIRRPDVPTRPVTPPEPAVKLSLARAPAVPPKAPAAPRRPGRWRRGKVTGLALGLGLTLAAVYGLATRGAMEPGGEAPRAVGQEMARAPDPADTGSAAAPLPLESTPAAAAHRAATSPEEPPVKAKQPHNPPPPKSPPPAGTGTNTLRKLCVGTALVTQAACANVPVARLPKPAECPPGAMQAMTGTLGHLFDPGSVKPLRQPGPDLRLAEGNMHWTPVRPGDVSAPLLSSWGALPSNTVLTGELYFGEGRVFGRFTQAWTPQGTVFPICAELWQVSPHVERGLEMRPGSTRDDVQVWSTVMAVPVRHFD